MIIKPLRHTVLLVLLYFATGLAQFQSVRIQVIDRGQADGILIRTPNQEWVVIDSGTNRQQADSMKTLWGVERVALVVVSHRHGDHYGGMAAILRDFDVDQFLGVMEDCPNRDTDDTIRGIISSKGIEVHPLNNVPIEIDGVRFTILPRDPVDDECPDDENDNSVIVRMDYGDFSMLFTGDAETEERKWLMANHPELLDVEVLKASHHGSRNGADGEVNGQSWLDIVSPEAVVISAHLNSQFGHPHPEAVLSYEQAVGPDDVYCTSRHGSLRVYGRQDGTFSVFKQFQQSGSCSFGSP